MTYVYILQDWRDIMRRAITTGLLCFVVIFIFAQLFGWAYSLAIGCLLIILLTITQYKK